jgi:hypothetical protein
MTNAHDTTDAASAAQIAAVRRLGAAGRVCMAAEMSEDALRIAVEGEQRRHSSLTQLEARLAVLCRIWGPDLARRVTSTR